MVKYQDLINIKVEGSKESFVVIDENIIPNGYIKPMVDMKKILKNKVIVRKTVYQKLINIQKELQNINPNLSLFICYGYRSLKTQTKLFLKQLRLVSKKKYFDNPYDLYEEIHKKIAVPEVAGHPTGGAIDLLIKNIVSNKFLRFGSDIYDFSSNKCEVFNKEISNSAVKNRLLLRNIMVKACFAPFDGEWWHFSYGDREWAFYYKKRNAIYKQISVKKLLGII